MVMVRGVCVCERAQLDLAEASWHCTEAKYAATVAVSARSFLFSTKKKTQCI